MAQCQCFELRVPAHLTADLFAAPDALDHRRRPDPERRGDPGEDFASHVIVAGHSCLGRGPLPRLRGGGRARQVPVQPCLEPPGVAQTGVVVEAFENRHDAIDGAHRLPRCLPPHPPAARRNCCWTSTRDSTRSSPISVAALHRQTKTSFASLSSAGLDQRGADGREQHGLSPTVARGQGRGALSSPIAAGRSLRASALCPADSSRSDALVPRPRGAPRGRVLRGSGTPAPGGSRRSPRIAEPRSPAVRSSQAAKRSCRSARAPSAATDRRRRGSGCAGSGTPRRRRNRAFGPDQVPADERREIGLERRVGAIRARVRRGAAVEHRALDRRPSRAERAPRPGKPSSRAARSALIVVGNRQFGEVLSDDPTAVLR